jgi:hypothetical protein
MRPLALLILLIALGACGPAVMPTPMQTVAPATPAPFRRVNITYPQDGTVVYADKVYLSGASQDIRTFRVQLVNPDGQTIAEATVKAEDQGTWKVELAHGYTGEPMEVTVTTLPIEGQAEDTDYAIATIVIAGAKYRPEGIFGRITDPTEDSTVGGDTIQLSGAVSGIPQGSFTLALMNGANIIDQQTVMVFNPYTVDEAPWTAELRTKGYTGPASIRAYVLKDGSQIEIGAIKRITVTTDAG